MTQTQTEAKPEIENQSTKKDPFHYRKIVDNFLIDTATKDKSNIIYYQGRTLRYTGKHYRPVEDMGNHLRRWLLERRIPFNNTVIGNVVPIIEARQNCDPQRYPQIPFWKKNSPCKPSNVITFNNGLLDVERAIRGDHTLMPHDYNWVALSSLPHDYDPTAACPLWLKFLDEVLEGDAERIANLQEFFGYSLTPDNSFQKMLVLVGVSRGGKGTVVSVLEAMIGNEGMTGFSLTSLADKFGLGGLVGKLVASVGEVNLQKHPCKYQIFERINNITGNDPVEVEFKHNPQKMSVRLPVRFVIACNEMPKFADDSGALAERLIVVPFEKACPPEKRDPQLGEKLAAEISGITNWAIQGLARLRSKGRFSSGPATEDRLNEIRRSNSPALAFAQDRLQVHGDLDTGNLPGVTVLSATPLSGVWALESAVKTAFGEWSAENGRNSDDMYLFSSLKVILPKLKRGKQSVLGGKRENSFVGVRLLPSP